MPGPIASLNEGLPKSDLRELVRKTVEDCFDCPEPDRDERCADWTVAKFGSMSQSEKL